ncbi:hypothetical protein [Streptacidiphilus carbonis]|uniref:hypothetical protein n=1 Tax=Streptacidiphilus carbonis TaxID=105422 RepID=UPI0005AB5870|nr:hypothetical protein [Streptacidiphilus carbonis]
MIRSLKGPPPVASAVTAPAGMAGEPADPQMRLVVWAARAGQVAEAQRLAEELRCGLMQTLAAEDDQVLDADEICAYLAHLAGDHLLAARLYRQAAGGWARSSAAAAGPATSNAEICEALASSSRRGPALARAEKLLRQVSASTTVAAAGVATNLTARAPRRSVAVTLLATALLVGGAIDLGPETAPTARPRATSAGAVSVIQLLGYPSTPAAPSPAPSSRTPAPMPSSPVPSPPAPVPSPRVEEVQSYAPVPQSGVGPTRGQAPRRASVQPARRRPSSSPRPARPTRHAHSASPQPLRVGAACAMGQASGYLPAAVIALCHQAGG